MLDSHGIGKRIAWLRREKGYTQEKLSNLLNVTPQAVSKWEKGSSFPDVTLLPLLGKVLDVSIDRLLTGNNVMESMSPYEEEYKQETYYWGLKPSSLAETLVNLLHDKSDKRLLDIGSGEGRDSVYFAKSGFHVDSLELSAAGIGKIEQYSRKAGCRVNTIHANLIGYDYSRFYDVIYSMGSLQFLPPEQRQKHFTQYKQQTRPGGINAHLVFVEKPFIETAPDWQNNEFYYLSGELAGYYHDWEILQYAEQIMDCHSANVPHQHAVNWIMARKR